MKKPKINQPLQLKTMYGEVRVFVKQKMVHQYI
jgi:hypothetical protein